MIIMTYVYLFTNTKLLNSYTYMYECVHDDIRVSIHQHKVTKLLYIHV